MSEGTYITELRCTNCYHDWKRQVEKGKDVEQRGATTLTFIDGKIIECPNCGSTKVSKRLPRKFLKEATDDEE